MPDDPRLRASDEDRDRAASLLREHHAAGRLSMDEFHERLDAVYAAKTLGQISELLADLPSIDLYHLPEQSMRRAQAAPPAVSLPEHGRLGQHWRAAWGSWASVSLVLFVIWLMSVLGSGGVNVHNLHNLWFLWVAGPWGAVLLGRWLFGGAPSGSRRGVSGPARQLGGDREMGRGEFPDERLRRKEDRHQQRDQRRQQRDQRGHRNGEREF